MIQTIADLIWQAQSAHIDEPLRLREYLLAIADEIRKGSLMEDLGAGQVHNCSPAESVTLCRVFGNFFSSWDIEGHDLVDLPQYLDGELAKYGWTVVPKSIQLGERSRSEEVYQKALALGLKVDANARVRYPNISGIAEKMMMKRQALQYHLDKVQEKIAITRRGGAIIPK